MELKVTWLGHSCFRIQADAYTVLIDPYSPDSVPGYRPLKESADLILFSHEHQDHHGVHGVGIRTGEENPFRIQKIDTFHDNKQGKLRGRNKIHVLEIGDYKLVHLGDLGCDLTLFQYGLLRDADVLMIPVGGYYTINAAQANKMAQQLHARVTIPMHYRTANYGFKEIALLEEYIRAYEGLMKFYDTSELVITKELEEQAAVLLPKYGRQAAKPAAGQPAQTDEADPSAQKADEAKPAGE